MADKIAVNVDEVFSKLPLEQLSLIKNYLALLFKLHATDNIISSSDEEYVIKREIYDSSILSKFVSGSSFTDVGSGGGIPGIILAILNPNKKITLIDRKTTFIDFLEPDEFRRLLVTAQCVIGNPFQFSYRQIHSLKYQDEQTQFERFKEELESDEAFEKQLDADYKHSKRTHKLEDFRQYRAVQAYERTGDYSVAEEVYRQDIWDQQLCEQRINPQDSK